MISGSLPAAAVAAAAAAAAVAVVTVWLQVRLDCAAAKSIYSRPEENIDIEYS